MPDSQNEITLSTDTKVSSSLQNWIVFISFVLTVGGFIMGFMFGLEKANARINGLNDRVATIEIDRTDRLKMYTDNQIKLEGRLTRIETVLIQMNAKLQ